MFLNSAEMKKGILCDVLGDIFRFVETRLHKISKDLEKIAFRNHFMDDEAFDARKRKQSTLLRWQVHQTTHT